MSGAVGKDSGRIDGGRRCCVRGWALAALPTTCVSLLTASSPAMTYGEPNAFAPQTCNGRPGCYHSNGLAAADCCELSPGL